MAHRRIENRRSSDDQNVQKNAIPPPQWREQAFRMADTVVQCRDDRDAIMESLALFIRLVESNIQVEGRDPERDLALLPVAVRVLARLT